MQTFYGALMLLPFFCPLVSPDAQGEALLSLKASLKASSSQLTDWSPNLINPCTWSKINCDATYNVISVSLSNMGFSGTLSPNIKALKKLTTLSLQGNRITGRIPEEVGNLSSLTMLNLENNQLYGEIPLSLGNLKMLQFLYLNRNNLTGTIPRSLLTLPSLTNLQLGSNRLIGQIPKSLFEVSQYNFTGNHLNCGFNFSQPCESRKVLPSTSKSGIVLAVVIGLIVLVGGLLIFCMRVRHKGYKRENFEDVAGDVDRQIEFGRFRKVYKGVLMDHTKIAVKRLTSYHSPSGDVAFYREVEMISVAVHRNLLRLIGFCTTVTERLLVYPFMPNLSVASRLRELQPGEAVLNWPTRNRVALGTARGLEYLHEHCNPKIIHRDVKAANVLLDEEFEAVVGDFGLAKMVDVGKTNVTTQVCGTMGHIAPEYLQSGKSSEKTDVFGYGVMLLELVTGQRVIDFSRHDGDDVLLVDLVKKLQRENRLHDIVDGNLKRNYNIEEVHMIIQVALLCTQASPEERPAMSKVVRMLEGEGLAEMWREWQHVEVTRNQDYGRLQKRIEWSEDSTYKQSAIELSGAR